MTKNTFIYIVPIAVLVLSAETRGNILGKYPRDLGRRQQLSCQNRCGEEEVVCSCQPRCRVYRNCCEDFKEVCPDQYNATEKISHILDRSIMCSRDHGVFMVESCDTIFRTDHNDVTMNENKATTTTTTTTTTAAASLFLISSYSSNTWTPFSSSNPTTTPRAETEASSVDKTRLMQEVLNGRPVVDLYSGITFTNWTVFSCYSHKESVPVLWDVYFAVSPPGPYRNMFELVQDIDYRRGKSSYGIPSSLKDSLVTVPCYHEAVHECPHSLRPTFKACSSFVSYLVSNDYTPAKVYNNIYCLRCNEPAGTVYKVVSNLPLMARSPNFSILVRLLNETMVVEPLKSNFFFKPNWKKTVCTYSETASEELENAPCRIEQCSSATRLTSDERCMYRSRVRLAVGNGDSSLTSQQIGRLPYLFSCILEEAGLQSKGFAVDGDQSRTKRPSPLRLSGVTRDLYVFEVDVNSDAPLDKSEDNLLRLTHALNSVNMVLLQFNSQGEPHSQNLTIENGQRSRMAQGIAVNLIQNSCTSLCSTGAGCTSRSLASDSIKKKNDNTDASAIICACIQDQSTKDDCDLCCEHTTGLDVFERSISNSVLYSKCIKMINSSLSSGSNIPILQLTSYLAIAYIAVQIIVFIDQL